MISGEAYDTNKQTIYIVPKSKIESRVHYAVEPAQVIVINEFIQHQNHEVNLRCWRSDSGRINSIDLVHAYSNQRMDVLVVV